MRAGADAEIIAISPIGKIMAALLAWRSVVRDFIGGQTCALANLLGQFIKPGSAIGVGDAQDALAVASQKKQSEVRS